MSLATSMRPSRSENGSAFIPKPPWKKVSPQLSVPKLSTHRVPAESLP